MFSSSRKKTVKKANPQSSSFASETFLLRRGSEATRYKFAALMMFIAGFALLTLGTWVLNDFDFLTFTNWKFVVSTYWDYSQYNVYLYYEFFEMICI